MEIKINGMKMRNISNLILLLAGTALVRDTQASGLHSAAIESATDLLRDNIAESRQLVDDLYLMTEGRVELGAEAGLQSKLHEFMNMGN